MRKMRGKNRHLLRRYGIIPPVITAALLLRFLLWPVLGAEVPLLFMWPAVLVCAWFGGFVPGLLATFLCVMAEGYFVVEPRFSFVVNSPAVLAGLILFVPLGLVFSLLAERTRRADRALREAARRKDTFIATLGHELRGQLTPVLHAAQVLRLKVPQQPEAQWAEGVIVRQVGHMTRLVDDLLDASRIQRGKLRLQKRPLELAAIVADAVEATRPLMSAHQHHVSVSLPPGSLRVEADSTRLTQILVNLLSNAARYTMDGGHIALCAEREGGQAVVRVTDDGQGIAPELLRAIFDPFIQAQGDEGRSQEGLGIGLALVRGLAEAHGGTVTARSAGIGHGSEFVVRLPLVADAPDATGPSPVKERDDYSVVSRRVLVVDDSADAAESLATLLRVKGHEVRTALDGREALKAVTGFRPEVVFLDIGLPGMSGYEVARRLREQPDANSTRLVALTGYGSDGDSERSKEFGFEAHLVKPCRIEDLEALLQTPPETNGDVGPGKSLS
jgi:signal transduction histidine kinase/CheY-like chemotaxis protein